MHLRTAARSKNRIEIKMISRSLYLQLKVPVRYSKDVVWLSGFYQQLWKRKVTQ